MLFILVALLLVWAYCFVLFFVLLACGYLCFDFCFLVLVLGFVLIVLLWLFVAFPAVWFMILLFVYFNSVIYVCFCCFGCNVVSC